MKDFSQLREFRGRKPKGRPVFSKRLQKVSVAVHKEMGKFVTYVDGDRLDAYNSQKEAEKAGMEFVKQFKS